jgi:hypothetical protein
MRNGKRIIELEKQLRNSVEYQRIGRIKRLSFTLKIFAMNTAHLKQKIELAHTPQVAFKLGGNQFLFEQYFLDMMRLLHNFVAASLTLIDHARRLHVNYADHPSFRDYKHEIKTRFAVDPLCQFVKNLRHYTLHWELPFIGSRVSVIPEVRMQHTMYIDRDQLLRWDGWTSHARAYLETSNTEIDLHGVVIEYERKIKDFYDWYYEKLREVHAKDISFVEAKQSELLRLEGLGLPGHLENELHRYQKSRTLPEDMFHGYVDPETLYKLTRSDTPAIDRAKMLLDYVSKYSTVPEKLRQRVINTFVEYYETSHTGGPDAKGGAERGNPD